jgi:hypothetical protein
MWVQLVSPVGNLGGYPGALGAGVGRFCFGEMEIAGITRPLVAALQARSVAKIERYMPEYQGDRM